MFRILAKAAAAACEDPVLLWFVPRRAFIHNANSIGIINPGRVTMNHWLAGLAKGGCFLLAVGWIWAGCGQYPASGAVGSIFGHARHQKVDGSPAAGYVELYEYNVWVCGPGDSTAIPFRTGAPPEDTIRYDGFFRFPNLADGAYTLILTQPLFFARSKIQPGIVIENGRAIQQHMEPASDYSVGLTDDWDPGWARVWHQTFVAQGTSITRVKTRLAGTSAKNLLISIHEDNGTASPTSWPMVGTAKARYTGEGNTYLTDIFVAWTSGEVPTTPGNRYAVRLQDADGNADFTPFRIIDSGQGYSLGSAFKDGSPTNADLHLLICSDRDGTIVTKGIVQDFNGNQLAGWGNEWGQSFIARGHSLAGFDLWFAHDQTWRQEAAVTIHKQHRNGEQVGPRKGTRSAYQTPGSGWLAVPYAPGEVPLEPGTQYFIKIDTAGMNCFQAPVASGYADGLAYRDGSVLPRDLYMSIYEYSDPVVPITPPDPLPVTHRIPLLLNGDMESGSTGTGGQTPDHWVKFVTSGNPTFWYELYGIDQSRAARLIGGAINGTVFDAGLVQRIDGLDPDRAYQVGGWLSSNVGKSLLHWGMIGYDLTGQTSRPTASTIKWIPMGGLNGEWKHWESQPVSPVGNAISIWLRAGTTSKTDTFFIDFDEVFLDEITLPTKASTVEVY
jgi:hypothetical protein